MKNERIRMLIGMLLVAVLILTACGGGEEELAVTLDQTALTINVGETAVVNASVSDAELAVTWTTSNAAVATVIDGTVTAVAPGTATITAAAGKKSASCTVTVAEAEKANITITEEEGYDGEISFLLGAVNVDLAEGLSAADDQGNAYDVVVADDGGFDTNVMGSYTITYKATGADGSEAAFARTAYVTYFGINADMLSNKAVSSLTSWTYVADTDDAKSAMEWSQHIAPGHSTNWNRFEGPAGMPNIVMHGSDTNGREVGGAETDDEQPNAMLWNKVTVPADNTTLRVYCSNNPYPDYNNLLSKVRVTVLDLETMDFATIGDYREIKAPLNETGDGLDYDAIRNNSYLDFDLSAFAGETVVVFIEQDAPAGVYQWDYYLDIGYLDFQIQPLIAETRDSLVIYSMSFE